MSTAPTKIVTSASPDKKMWHRSEDVLDFLTFGQALMMRGEISQNPFYLSQGCGIMLEIITHFIKEKHVDTKNKAQVTVGEPSTSREKDF